MVRQRNQRVETYRQMVRPLAVHYARCSPESSDDLTQVGLLGLIRAAELYRRDRNIPFEAFARPHIRGAILHYLRDVAPRVRLPRRQAELQERLNRLVSDRWAAQRSEDPNPQQSADQCRRSLGVSDEQWRLLARQRLLNRAFPLEATPQAVREAATPVDQELDDPGGDDGSEGRGHESSSCRALKLLDQLETRQSQVVRRVVLNGWSYRKVGLELGISPMTVQRVLKRGLDQLRQQLDDSGFRPGNPADRDAFAPPAC